MLNQDTKTIVGAVPYLELNNGKATIHFPLIGPKHQLGRNCPWADLQTPEDDWQVLSREHARLVQMGKDYQILDGNGQEPSRNGLFMNHHRIDGSQGQILRHGMTLTIGQNPKNLIRLTYCNPSDSTAGVTPSQRGLSLKNVKEWPVLLGRSPGSEYNSLELPAPTVSRIHARVERVGADRYQIRDNSSANGTFVNGQPISGAVVLEDNAVITIGPFQLVYRYHQLELRDRGNQIRLDAHQIVREVSIKGDKKRILNQVSLPIEPGQLVALVGGSGAGKSTLMKTLLGIEPLRAGAVYLNGMDLRQNFHLYRTQIGYVPQDDIVHYQLRVDEVLHSACKLRLPPDTDFNQVITQTLKQVQLSHVRNTFIKDLSGGQRKRVSIAVELLADPKLFFLDEPTSGLDPGLDKQMMILLRELADQGRTVVLVTHATANITSCDRIAFMGRGGYLCYYGPPLGAMDFFEMPSNDLQYFSDVYIKLDQEQVINGQRRGVPAIVQDWCQRFKTSPQHRQYIGQTLSGGNQDPDPTPPSRPPTRLSPLRQWLYLSQRYGILVNRDRFSLILSLLTAPLTLIILKLALGDETPFKVIDPLEPSQGPLALRVLFIFTCLSIWIGLSSSVQAIIKEVTIYNRERLVNLGILPYLASKLGIHGGIALVQTLLITVTALITFDPPEPELIPWWLGLATTTFLTLMANISLGLMISSWVKNEDQGNSILPPIMLFQIILSGVLFQLNGLGDLLSFMTMSRWSNNAYAAIVNINAMVPPPVTLPDGSVVPAVFEPSSLYDPTWENLGLCWAMLGLQTLLYLGFSVWGLAKKDVV
ncbi:ATP-binding cassette domain-containing protein [Prochlorothrix hollandica]|uniref:Maltooligosyl trehalose synthase n=1 Tax=Prochlorothrix hollandica PCC 9006 = CALU 1027 TaxID=317619 RepID=A0A0M2PPL3_PROHO|nr:ATP-binding cassette domain-containing protein [Prochlorothrix hollandica]KKI98204.1 maltooligosyl trehalose synthase [Prochlorothrix hollandica PCC 9006 = CALU 1027]